MEACMYLIRFSFPAWFFCFTQRKAFRKELNACDSHGDLGDDVCEALRGNKDDGLLLGPL